MLAQTESTVLCDLLLRMFFVHFLHLQNLEAFRTIFPEMIHQLDAYFRFSREAVTYSFVHSFLYDLGETLARGGPAVEKFLEKDIYYLISHFLGSVWSRVEGTEKEASEVERLCLQLIDIYLMYKKYHRD